MKKDKKYHTAAGGTVRYRSKRPVFHATAQGLLFDRSYAVDDQTEHFTSCKPDSPAAEWKISCFFTKMLH